MPQNVSTKNHQLSAVDYFKAKLDYDIGPFTLKELIDKKDGGYKLIDVRSTEQYAEGHIPTALNFPLAELPAKLSSLPKDKMIVTYCGSITCQLAPRAALELAQKGFKVKELHGGIKEWREYGYPVEGTA